MSSETARSIHIKKHKYRIQTIFFRRGTSADHRYQAELGLFGFGHVTKNDTYRTLPKTLLQGWVEGERRRGKQKERYSKSKIEWTDRQLHDLLEGTQSKPDWRAYTKIAAVHDALPKTGNSIFWGQRKREYKKVICKQKYICTIIKYS